MAVIHWRVSQLDKIHFSLTFFNTAPNSISAAGTLEVLMGFVGASLGFGVVPIIKCF